MFDDLSLSEQSRGISKVMGVVLMTGLTVATAAGAFTMVMVVGDSGSPAVHSQASFSIEEHQPDGDPVLAIVPDAVAGDESTFVLEINGKTVHEWDGRTQVNVHCLFTGDTITVYKRTDGKTELVERRVYKDALSCPSISKFGEKFEYVTVNGEKVRIRDDSSGAFGLKIDPDGPGADTHTNVGPMPLSNPWHYGAVYPDTEIEGMEPPVWVFVMTDNVHRPGVPSGNGALNWSDPPPGNPGAGSYSISNGQVQPTPSGSEPTNDIYLVFNPGCSGSEIKLVAESAGYDNQITLNGAVVIPNTNTATQNTVISAPAISCGS